MIRVLIADDQKLIRQSLKLILEKYDDINVVGIVENGKQAIEFVKRHSVDIILMDIRMPIIDGVQCTKQIKRDHENIKIIILTTFDDDNFISDAIRYGAEGYLLKEESINEVVEAIKKVYNGSIIINEDVTKRLAKLYCNLARNSVPLDFDAENFGTITKTERTLIVEVGNGLSNKEIAEKLFLSEGTIRNYLSKILSKLDLRDRTQLAIWSIKHKDVI